MKVIILCIVFLLSIYTPYAQEKGFLGSVLNQSCRYWSELDFDINKTFNNESRGYAAFCSGYFESVIEHKQFIEEKDIFKCVPTYAYYDVFKKSAIQNFMSKFHEKYTAGEKYIRAFDLARDAVDEEFESVCTTKQPDTSSSQ